MRSLLLRVHPEPDGSWSAWVGPLLGQAERVSLDAEAVAAIRADLRKLRRPPAVCVRGHAAAQERREEDLGRSLAALLHGSVVAGVVGQLRGLARSEGAPLCLLVDAPQLPEVPWELIAWSPWEPPIEAEGGRVVRLGGSMSLHGVPRTRGRLRALLWCPTPEDPACQASVSALQKVAEAGAVELVDLADAPPVDEEVAELLFIVCHGRVVEGGGELLLGGGSRYAGAISAELSAALGRVCLVMLDTCSGASPEAEALSQLTARLLRGGAPACVAPAGVLDAEASRLFAAALLQSLSAGRSLPDAAAAGRAAVAKDAHPHPSARPYNLQLVVASAAVLRGPPPVELSWSPPGWPRVSAELRALLGRAHGLSKSWGQAHVGLEHLVQATRPVDGGPGVRVAHAALMRAGERFWVGLRAALWVQDGAPVQASPRVIRLGAALPEGAGVQALWAALTTDPNHGLHAITDASLPDLAAGGLDETATLRVTRAEPSDPPPATRFELVWGPDCGALLTPEPGQHIGRAALKDGPELPLYADGHCTDRKLSRRHVRYLGEGRVQLLRPARLVRGDDTVPGVPLSGEVALFVGDLLLLTDATWLRAVG